jgi:hypothetical protein
MEYMHNYKCECGWGWLDFNKNEEGVALCRKCKVKQEPIATQKVGSHLAGFIKDLMGEGDD